jgi:periplasmic mercuric ion binding protein
MKSLFVIVILSVSSLFASPLWAANKSVRLSVPGMTCAVCPITVKKSMINIKGVNTVEVSFENKLAVVTFDDSMTNVEALTDATFDAGYPSTVTQ